MLILFCRPYLGFRACWVGVSGLTPTLEPHRGMETKYKIFSLFITVSNKLKKKKKSLFPFFGFVLTLLVFFWGYQGKVANPAGRSAAHCFNSPHPSYFTIAWKLFKIPISWMLVFIVSPNENRNFLNYLCCLDRNLGKREILHPI